MENPLQRDCDRLNRKCPHKACAEELVPCWWHYFGSAGNVRRLGLEYEAG